MKKVKKFNPMASALTHGLFRAKVVKNKKKVPRRQSGKGKAHYGE